MRHPLNWLLRVGRTDAERTALLGDLEEERRARMAAGSSRIAAVAWYTREVVYAFACALRDARPSLRLAVGRDIRYTLRRWRQRPGFAAAAMLTLGLGIAAATSIFSIVDAVLLKPLPWRAPESLVVVHGVYPDRRNNPATAPTWNRGYLSYPAWDALRTASAFESVGAWRHVPLADTTLGDDRTEIITTLEMSSSFLPMLAVELVLGRYFNDLEDNVSTNHIILTHEIWQRRFGGRSDVIGERVMLGSASSGERYPKTIIGVVEPGFRFDGIRPDLLLPIGIPANTFRKYPSPALRVIARLAPGISLPAAGAQAEALVSAAPNERRGSARVVPIAEDQLGSSKRPLALLFGAAGLLLLVACSNVAGLLLGEARVRRHEIAVRSALGGSRAHVARQLVVEHSLLALAGLAVGLTTAYWLTGAIVAVAPPGMPRIETTALDWRAVSFALIAGLATLLTFGIAPAVSLARTPTAAVLAEGGRGGGPMRFRAQRLIVAAQVAIALVLVTTAALFGETILRLHAQPLGFDPGHVGAIATTFTGNQFGDSAQAAAAWRSPNAGRVLSQLRSAATAARTDAVLERLAAIPGVVHVAAAAAPPFMRNPYYRMSIALDGRPNAERHEAAWHAVTEGYFATMGIPIPHGRGFDRTDVSGERVAVVSVEFERRFFPDGAIGRGFRYLTDDPAADPVVYRIVGTAPDVKRQDPTDDDRPAFYVYARQERHFLPTLANHFLIRTARDPALARPAARRAIADVSPQLVVTSMTTMSSRVEQSVAEERFRATLAAVFGTSALVLAAVGLYGLAARRVADRRREFGVRAALGARPRDVRRLVVRDAALIVSLGLAAGLPAAVAAAQLARSLLFGVTPTAPHVFAAAAVALGVVAAAATALPARRASRIDPVHVLKQ